MSVKFPQVDLPRGVSGASDLWDDDGAAGQILRADYFAQDSSANVAVSSSQQANTASSGAISQTHKVSVASAVSQTNAASSSAVKQTHKIGVSNATQANAASSAETAQMKLVAAVSVTQANRATSAQVHAQRHYITRVDTVSRIPGAMVIGDAGAFLIYAANVAQANAASGGLATQIGGATPANVTQVNVAASAAIRQTHKVGSASVVQTNAASGVSLLAAASSGNSMRVDTGPLISGAMVVGDAGHGVLGSAIPGSGDDGPGYLYDFITLPGDTGKEVRGLVTTWPVHGTLFPYEDSSFVYTPAPGFVGTDSFAYQPYVDGIPVGSPRNVDITIAAEPHRVSFASATQHNAASSVSLLRDSLVVPSPVSQANSASSGAIKQQHMLSCANATQANACSPGSLGIQPRLIVAAPVAIDNVASASAIVQTHLILAGNAVVIDNVASALTVGQTHLVRVGNAVGANAASLGRIAQYSYTTLLPESLSRLAEIWARMELDPARPVVVSTTEIEFGTITQAIGAGGAARIGAPIPHSEYPDVMILEVWQRLGLDPDNPLVQTQTSLDFGAVHCTITEVAGTVTVARQ